MQEVDIKTYQIPLVDLFKSGDEVHAPNAILEGSMGKVFVDDLENPQICVLAMPEEKMFFLGGDSQNSVGQAYIKALPIFAKLIFSTDGWRDVLVNMHPKKWAVMPRFKFTSESLDLAHLKTLQAKLPEKFRIQKIDRELSQSIMDRGGEDEFTGAHFFGFDTADDFMQRGFGYCAFLEDELVSIAAAGAADQQGIEIQINTLKAFEGQGLGTAVAATLIIDCLEQDIEPNWDAANEASAGLAKKLGYTPAGEYLVYVFLKYRFLVNFRSFLRRVRGMDILEP